ncbi:MAG: hypothetical protein ACTHNG_13120 [Ginsengibacter sp.]
MITGLVLLLATGYFIWQHYKYKFARNSITSTVKNQTDSLYSIKYDSLSFDAVTGHATMKNIRIVPDTARIRKMAVENMPDIMVDVTIKSLVVTGVQTAKALHTDKIEGDSVILNAPQILIYSLKPIKKTTIFQNEAHDLYRQILGKLDRIKVGFVFVNNVHIKGVDFFNKNNNFELINGKFVLEDVLIDSSHNSDPNRILYCKQAAFTVDSFFSYNHNREDISVKQVHFLGKQQKLTFKSIKVNRFVNDTSSAIRLLDANDLSLHGVNTNEIVKNKNLSVDTISCGSIKLYAIPASYLKTTHAPKSKDTDSTGFTRVYSVQLAHLNFPKVTLIPTDKSDFSIGNVSITLNGVNAGRVILLEDHPMNYTKEAEVNVDRFSFASKDKTYRFNLNNMSVNSLSRTLHIASFDVLPFASEQKFANSFHFQKDRYKLHLSGLSLHDIDMNSFVDNRFIAKELFINNADATISRDLHKPLKHESKIGNYPSQILKKIDHPINISSVKIKNAFVQYRENESVSDSIGVVQFTNTSFDITNLTNMPEAIQKNNLMNISFSTRALSAIPMKGNFKFVLDSKNGDFFVNGTGKSFDAKVLNKISVPMALVRIKSGDINSIHFDFRGNNKQAGGNFLMNYKGMKISVLKRDEDTKKIKKRGLISLAANMVVNNYNSGTSVKAQYDRNIYKSFFNLVWKTIFAGMKETLGVPKSVGE